MSIIGIAAVRVVLIADITSDSSSSSAVFNIVELREFATLSDQTKQAMVATERAFRTLVSELWCHGG